MKVADVMRTNVVTVTAATPLRKINELLHRFNLSYIVIAEEGVVKGIMTYADLFRQILPSYDEFMQDESYWLNPEATEQRASDLVNKPVGEVMSRSVITVSPDMEAVRAGALMTAKKVKQLPVVKDGQLVGVVSLTDITWGFLMRPLFG
jgi:CBS domain-containing protein